MKNFLKLLVLLILPAIAHAQATPQIKPGTPYAKVRSILLKEGWKPVGQEPESFDSMAQDLKQRGWIETKECAGSGLAPCIFTWKNLKGKEIEIVTTGEEPKFNGFR